MHFARKITAHGIYLPTHLQGFWKANEGQVEVKRVIWVQALLSLDNPARMVGLRWEDSHTGVLWVLFKKKKKKRNTHPSEGSHIGLLGGASIPACINSAQLLSGWVLPDGNRQRGAAFWPKEAGMLPPPYPPPPDLPVSFPTCPDVWHSFYPDLDQQSGWKPSSFLPHPSEAQSVSWKYISSSAWKLHLGMLGKKAQAENKGIIKRGATVQRDVRKAYYVTTS